MCATTRARRLHPAKYLTNAQVERLTALQARSRLALRELADRAESDRVAIQGLAAGVKSHLRVLPEVAAAAVGAVQVLQRSP